MGSGRMNCVRRFVLFVAFAVSVTVRADEPGTEKKDATVENSSAIPAAAALEFFEARVRPLLIEHCYECHSAADVNGGLRLDSRDGVLAGGDSGPTAKPGDPDHSLLIEAVRYKNRDLQMPPKNPLSAEDVATLERWVKIGLPDPRVDSVSTDDGPTGMSIEDGRKFWSMQLVRNPEVPNLLDGAAEYSSRMQSPVDAFLFARMAAAGVKPVGPADKRTLIHSFSSDDEQKTIKEVEAEIAQKKSAATSFKNKIFGQIFSRYHLCRTLGWPTDGRTYRRLEDSFDRIAGTTLKFKDGWWDKGDVEWKSKTFHLIEEVELCSRDQIDRRRLASGAAPSLSSFVWSDVIWKSFQDGYMKKLDMTMWRRIGSGRRREVPLRLYRILDKRFYHKRYVQFDVRQLCLGTLGVSRNYCPAQMVRVLKRASDWLIECGFLRDVKFESGSNGELQATFVRASGNSITKTKKKKHTASGPSETKKFFDSLASDKQQRLLANALEFCEKHRRDAYSGFQRNRQTAGPTFEVYRELVLSEFLKSRTNTRPKNRAA